MSDDNRGTQTEQGESYVEAVREQLTSRRSFLAGSAAAAGAVGLGGVGVVGAHGDERKKDDHAKKAMKDGKADDGSRPFAGVEFTNQFSGGRSVVVDEVVLSAGGFVAIHDLSLLDGKVLESVVGVTEFLEAGEHHEVRATLFDVKGADFETDRLEASQPLIAMPHLDTNGTETYDFVATGGKQDGPYLEAGQAVVDLGFVTVGEDGADDCDGSTAFATIDFENQVSDGRSIVVDEVVLSEGGFVAIHDRTLLEGNVIGSVIGVSAFLPPGVHYDVPVTLFEVKGADFETDRLTKTQPLIPMPHLDTNDTETYDFVTTEGKEDGPYVKAGNAVVDLGIVTVDE
ncbi:DUF7282 domain-containing protein [Halomarina pelagica]|uniref:DUF7282 domain-containing protein n=1 Tax=Halomarina pelagica TaxID=2961599 RepID=UPI0020C2C097|nr:twin-arginine translocation signal domain-containing protein [Halomarina sp. BND7]